ncbi:MAG: putative quinol monooxygenase [Pseudomonadota bacterium]
MFVLIVEIEVVGGRMDEFLPLVTANATASVADEPGCRQFDVCVARDRADFVTLYEVYDSEAAFAAHKGTPHFAAFDAAAGTLMASKTATVFTRTAP